VDSDGDGSFELVEGFVYNDDSILLVLGAGESDSALTEVNQRYFYGPGTDWVLAEETAGEGVEYALTNHLNSVEFILDSAGEVINRIIYDSFGNITSETNPGVDVRYGFTGQDFDPETGLSFYWTRYYDFVTGTFLTLDRLGFEAGDVNLYRYVGNSPTNFVDPSGQIAFWAGVFIAGAVIPFLADAISPDGVNTPTVVNGEGGIPQGEEPQNLDRSLQRAGVEFVLGLNPRSLLKSSKTVVSSLKNFADDAIRIGDSAVEAGESLIKRIFRKTNFNEVPVIGTFDETLEALDSQIRHTIDDFDLSFYKKFRKGTGAGVIGSSTGNSFSASKGGNSFAASIGEGPNSGNIPGRTNNIESLDDFPRITNKISDADKNLYRPKHFEEIEIRDGIIFNKSQVLHIPNYGDLEFVVGLDGKIVFGNRHQHLAKIAGDKSQVLAAGRLNVKKGKISTIDNLSGHFLPSEAETLNFPKLLRQNGLNLKGTRLQIWVADDSVIEGAKKLPDIILD